MATKTPAIKFRAHIDYEKRTITELVIGNRHISMSDKEIIKMLESLRDIRDDLLDEVQTPRQEEMADRLADLEARYDDEEEDIDE